MKSIENCDYILSLGTFFKNSELKNSLINSCKNGASFTYMHPIDNFELKDFYTQFIKYEAGSEEAILALILNFFSKNKTDELEFFLENLDIGYLSAESSAGEEEFEEAFLNFEKSDNKALIVGDDLVNHIRVQNIVKLLVNIKKYTDFKLIFLDATLEQKVNSCSDLSLDEVADLKSFNGTLVYFLNKEINDILVASQTFANIAKVKDGNRVNIKLDNQIFEKVIKIDSNLLGTIALIDEKSSSYRFAKVIVEKKEEK